MTCMRSSSLTGTSMEVYALGPDPSRVAYLQVTWSDYMLDDKIAVSQLDDFAGLRYASAEAARARVWLAANIGTTVRVAADTGAVTVIGAVRLAIKKVPSTGDYILELGAAG